ncbi:hypothetical protein MJO28_000075 [Puccinia striiformis f. sp. tritici]|uniref:MARVEL domain-containing protein n=4 Tax=Puccinia striiformis TaxID=27350 RepID=A0A0L0UUS8_9BASI|nr:hypothetical protein Pst134EA_001127 [Puccinia striiformis f. sp. tritici]KAI9631528.1 hypothetical protein KEM48_014277 [Puccinia striiformis f. sp. tritici PST-130]KNE90788.1 hypothetical protein PSTG_15796 [Puccinia striiformis f. sp. tritici PST-78]POW11964.1 hypothetical protein PSHT_08228 [Puccinia striiformis]KAH9474078.1 hypothetical protein Pst134EA_001127 [Puccinia striiformis f. sp. tritici]KAI7961981.1 hypothetical protein MJO28_000075 [Puccinia striiformis f. sp. tritici]
MSSSSNQAPTPKQFVMTQSLTGVKHALYMIVALFSFILFIVGCVVVPFERDTYGGYNPPAAELAFVGAVGAFFTPVFVWAQRVRPDFIFNSLAAELAYCLFMWFFLLGGAGGLSSQTYDLLACQNLFICRGFSTMMAFAWLNWIIFTVVTAFLMVIIGKLWSRQSPVKWTAPVKHLYLASRGEVEQFSDPSIPEKSPRSSSAGQA